MPVRAPHPSLIAMRTTVLGIAVSAVLVGVKLSAGYWGHSYALVADGFETASDLVSSSLLWLALRFALQPPDQKHPYGHGKAEPLAALAIALLLLLTAAGIAWQAIDFIRTPHALPQAWTLWVLAAVMLIKESLSRYVRRVGQALHSQAVLADAQHHRADALTSLAAFVGVALAVGLGHGYEAADDWAALVAAAIIFANGLKLLRPAVLEVMDAAPPHELVARVRQLAAAVPQVAAVEKCQVRKMGFDYYVDLHVEVRGDLTVREGHAIAHAVKDCLLQSDLNIQNTLVHIEPFGD